MRIAVTQPNFLPWLGYFELLDQIDGFVVLDDVQLVRRSFIVRNRLFAPKGDVSWCSASVAACPRETTLDKALMFHGTPWWAELSHRIEIAYRHCPEWPSAAALCSRLAPLAGESVAEYNFRLVKTMADGLGIPLPPCWFASQLETGPADTPEQRMLGICRALGADAYCNFRKGIDIGLYTPAAFARAGVRLYRQDYRHPSYSQHREGGFVPYLSALDMIACVPAGERAALVRGGRRWEPVD